MAIYYLDVKPIGGNSCRTAVGAAAYRAGEKLYNQNDGITHDYTNRRGAVGTAAYRSGEDINDGNITHDFTKKGGIVYSEIMLPKHALEAYQDRSTLWNAAEKAERNCNARTAREVVVALPNELTTEQQIKLVRDYVQRNFVNEGMCADFSIHSGHIHEQKGEIYPFQDLTVRKDNPHAHIQLTVRPIKMDGTWGEKSKKEYILDKNGDRIKLPSGNWKSRKIELTDWDKTETLLKWREDWAVTVNKEFERLGIDERIDHRTLKEQGINREPTKHMGHEAWNLEKKGIKTRIGNENRAIMKRNKVLEQVEKETYNEAHSPAEIVNYMNDLQERYKIIDKHITECAEMKREVDRINYRIKNMAERATEVMEKRTELAEAIAERNSMKFWQSKKEINERINRLTNSERQVRDFFVRTFKVEIEAVPDEIQRNKAQAESISKEIQSNNVEKLHEIRDSIAIEYQKQRLLTEIRPDGEEILNRIKTPPAQLGNISEENFKCILHDLRPTYAKILMEKREKSRARVYERLR